MKKHILFAVSLLALVALGCGSDGSGDDDPGGNGDGGTPGDDGAAPQDLPPPFSECSGASDQPRFDGELICFTPEGTPVEDLPLAAIEHEFVTYNGVPAVHIRLTLNPDFVDNTYGVNKIGWNKHTFDSLVGSDHAQIVIVDATGEVIFDVKIDYITQDPNAPCGYASLGVSGGDGDVLIGDETAILAWRTSLDQNLNERGYCDYTTDSPATDENCTPNPDAPDWDFRVVYELWIALSAFDPDGFGSAHMDFVHASPAKGGTNTITVEPADCPPGICNDPDGCDNGPGGTCDDSNPCPSEEFCYEGDCLPIIG